MGNFFRIEESGYIFEIFGGKHIIFLLGLLLCILYISRIKENEKLENIKNVCLSMVLLQQICLYSWYIISGYFDFAHSLPLYTCRVAMLCLVVGEHMNIGILKKIGVCWGLPGSIIAFLYPVLDPFGIDHFTFYSFFLGHIGLLFACLVILKLERTKTYYNLDVLREIIVFSSIYNFVIVFVNKLVNGNYCYVSESPINIGLLTNLSGHVYNVVAIILFDLVLILSYLSIKKLVLDRHEEKTLNEYLYIE